MVPVDPGVLLLPIAVKGRDASLDCAPATSPAPCATPIKPSDATAAPTAPEDAELCPGRPDVWSTDVYVWTATMNGGGMNVQERL